MIRKYFIVIILSIIGFSSLCLAAKPWHYWQNYDNSSAAQIDHSDWQDFLDKHVRIHNGTSLIDYHNIDNRSHNKLRGYLRKLSQTNIHQYNQKEQLAFWLNLHNALTIELILKHRPPSSILDIQLQLQYSSIDEGGPWHENIIRIHGTGVSLYDIEFRIIKPLWQDIRTNFALHHGAKGYPNLHPQAFTAANLQNELDAVKENFLQSTKAFEVSSKTLKISKWFKRYQSDFGEVPQDIIKNVSNLCFIPSLSARYTKTEFKDINWDLNSPKS